MRARTPRARRAGRPLAGLLAIGLALAGCATSPPLTARRHPPIAEVEAAFLETRTLRDRIDVARSGGADRTFDGVPVADATARYGRSRTTLGALLAASSGASLAGEDRRALDVMKRTFERDLGPLEAPAAETRAADCAYDPAALAAGPDGLARLSERVYACFGNAARRIEVDGETLDRLTILGRLGRTEDPAARRRLFLALAPVWRSVNRDASAASPYRRMLRLSARAWKEKGSPVAASARDLGVDPRDMERWLISILEAWRALAPAEPVEPWDFYYVTGEASRVLSPRIAAADLPALNERVYAALGASPRAIGVRYDLEPRDGKTPVAFTTFGARGAPAAGAAPPSGPEPCVFATYRTGGFDNLVELLHETGHAIHIAAIRTRPAFLDWPDSDPYTEALGDLVALEAFEPEWQERTLGASVSALESRRAKYAGIVMDVAWALFEMRLHEDPERDPNEVWTSITSTYLGIRPHPELSWWAIRGQLLNAPGYMANYALGAVIAADLRARAREKHGSFTTAGAETYAWLSEELYRFGLERPTRDVLTGFLGRPLSPRALLEDMRGGAAMR